MARSARHILEPSAASRDERLERANALVAASDLGSPRVSSLGSSRVRHAHPFPSLTFLRPRPLDRLRLAVVRRLSSAPSGHPPEDGTGGSVSRIFSRRRTFFVEPGSPRFLAPAAQEGATPSGHRIGCRPLCRPGYLSTLGVTPIPLPIDRFVVGDVVAARAASPVS